MELLIPFCNWLRLDKDTTLVFTLMAVWEDLWLLLIKSTRKCSTSIRRELPQFRLIITSLVWLQKESQLFSSRVDNSDTACTMPSHNGAVVFTLPHHFADPETALRVRVHGML